MYISGQHFSKDTLEWIQSIVHAQPEVSMRELSRDVCRLLEWRSPNGQLCELSCRKTLAELNRRGILALPQKQEVYTFQQKRCSSLEFDPPEVHCELNQLGQVSVYPISSRYSKDSKLFFALLDKYHYLGSGSLCGQQIRYLVHSSVYGHLGAVAFDAASWAIKARDKYIGWTETARRTNLNLVVRNARFLILPTVKVPNLASHVLSLALSRLPQDWEQRYSVRPVLAETFVDPNRFFGTCYKAANWILLDETTAGRRDGVPKKIFLFPFCPSWREALCHEPEYALGEIPLPEEPDNWAEHEFGAIRLYDNRLKQRLYTIAQDFFADPEGSIPRASECKARTMGAYRFFQNPKIHMDVLLDAHKEATLQRIREHSVVLAPQDTTSLNYSTHPMTDGLGPINTSDDSLIGLILHDTLAFTEDGTPLGVLDAQCWARDPEVEQKRKQRKKLPIEQKESIKWLRSFEKVTEIQRICPNTKLVSIGDRESDIYELFVEARDTHDAPGLLVRAEKSRNRMLKDELMWNHVAKKPVSGSMKIHVPRSGSRKARDTRVDIRHTQVTLKPPNRLRFRGPVTVWAVYVLEQEHPNPIEWMLITTEEVSDFQSAQKCVEWYSTRWGIEVYHRTLKSGCRLKDRQLGNADRLHACLGVDMVVAWRIYHLTMLGREVPDVPCTAFFSDIEWKALYCYVHKTPEHPEQPPTLSEAIYMLGGIGGHLGRKNDGPPGTQTLWRGLQRLDTATEMYAIMNPQANSSMPSGP
jgi:hypothetical protein